MHLSITYRITVRKEEEINDLNRRWQLAVDHLHSAHVLYMMGFSGGHDCDQMEQGSITSPITPAAPEHIISLILFSAFNVTIYPHLYYREINGILHARNHIDQGYRATYAGFS